MWRHGCHDHVGDQCVKVGFKQVSVTFRGDILTSFRNDGRRGSVNSLLIGCEDPAMAR